MILRPETRTQLLLECRRRLESPMAKRAYRMAQRIIVIGVVAFLVYRLSQLGWADVLRSLPASPWFYLFFLLRFMALPISEMANYEMLWRQDMGRHLLVFIRKRVYNFAVLGYSGEVFINTWAQRALPVSNRDVLLAVKDNNLLSAFTSNMATLLLVIALSFSERLRIAVAETPGATVLFLMAFSSASILSIGVFVIRRRLTSLTDGSLAAHLSVHAIRQFGVIMLHAAMYASALPGASMEAWLAFITLQLVISRIPFLPNQELVYLGAALTVASLVGAPEAAVAGMLLVEAGLSQIVNFSLFFATAHLARDTQRPHTTAVRS